ncbi:MAG: Ferredoxin-6 [Alphaproteobacteria bacterium MarineAlpha5_Bin8]|nr:MAG: Ferredoxin-6 [Alphaproteobacteria bacterium MarineAlpha5_Bin8]PPR45629.1 MAG: Ferredoxin-6 [Alphaproteobacteria bacterium MarineAlpha5_Bin7]PPR54323.1 MAG: Ferredoxin-6 [Alphaproteobacteria bacterium MarineAlpha5_Bin6]|tara:strand:- start:2243 stop:2554 length:312 start_codon:yes stop_codon:yes gene_type:complete
MGSIIVLDREGKEHKLNAQSGLTIMEIIRDAGLDIEAACGGCCACATCHVYLDKDSFSLLKSMQDDEESMLDQAFSVNNYSRLSCQIEYEEKLDGIKMTLAPE